MQDIRHAIRMLAKTPGFTLIVVLTLALGIGANTAMFSVISAIFIEPLPYKNADQLMVITERDEKHNQVQPYTLSYLNFQDWSAAQHSFSELSLFSAPNGFKIIGRNQASGTFRRVSGNFLSLVGVAPIVGRNFTPDDDREGAIPTVILSYSGWLRHFGPSRIGAGQVSAVSSSVLGEKLQFNDKTYDVIGILPREFSFYTADSNNESDGYIPVNLDRPNWTVERGRRPGLSALGRLKPGVTSAAAQGDLESIARQLATLYPDANKNRGAAVTPILESIVREDLRTTLSLFSVAVVLVLLIACANVTNLLLARATTRQKEIAIRFALGGRWQVVRQLITESLLLAVIGGAAGVVVAIASLDLLVLNAPFGLPRIAAIGISWRVLLFSIIASMASGLAFSVVPLVQAFRTNTLPELKQAGTSSVASRHATQKIIIVGEIAIAMLLLLGAGLILRSTQNALHVDPGFDPKQMWSIGVTVGSSDFKSAAERRKLMRELETRFAAIPDVRAVSIAIGGLPKPIAVTPAYLRLMGIRLLKGRFFDDTDTNSSPPTIVIDDQLARARFRDENPLGKPFVIDLPGVRELQLDRPREVIGVVSHIQRLGIETDDETVVQSQFYLAVDQLPDELMENVGPRLLLRAPWTDDQVINARGARLVDRFLPVVRSINPNLDVGAPLKMQDAVERALLPRRFVSRLFGVFAVIAFIMAGMGIFGLVSYSVSQRTQEIGVRMALGAESKHVVRMVLGQAAILATSGIVIGLVASVWLKRYIEHLLFNVSAGDPMTYIVAATLLFGVTIAAAYLPAIRASRVEPMTALRGAGMVIAPPATNEVVTTKERWLPPATESAIEVSNLHKVYKSPALAGVSFSVPPGTIFGLIGANGAGKTTLVKILMGLAMPSSGSARLLGCSPGDPVAKRQIGYLPEHMKIPQHFSPEPFLRYMGNLNEVDSDVLEARIPALLEKVGLGDAHKPVKDFSKGMLQRLGLAQALLNDPELLFLDEPTDGLDPLGRIFVRDLLVQLKAAGKTVFLNSHLLSEIELVCDQIVILDKGKVACTTSPTQFTRGTGEYVMRVDTSDPIHSVEAHRLTERVVGSATWTDAVVRFRPRDTEQLNDLLDALRGSRVPILSLEPVRLSLEQFFIQVVTEKES